MRLSPGLWPHARTRVTGIAGQFASGGQGKKDTGDPATQGTGRRGPGSPWECTEKQVDLSLHPGALATGFYWVGGAVGRGIEADLWSSHQLYLGSGLPTAGPQCSDPSALRNP